MNLALSLMRKMGRMGVMAAKFFEPPSSSFQGGFHISHQASLLPEERGCNRPPELGTALLYGWRGIKALRHRLRDGTAWGGLYYVIIM